MAGVRGLVAGAFGQLDQTPGQGPLGSQIPGPGRAGDCGRQIPVMYDQSAPKQYGTLQVQGGQGEEGQAREWPEGGPWKGDPEVLQTGGGTSVQLCHILGRMPGGLEPPPPVPRTQTHVPWLRPPPALPCLLQEPPDGPFDQARHSS